LARDERAKRAGGAEPAPAHVGSERRRPLD
jgi:hypothetical protein